RGKAMGVMSGAAGALILVLSGGQGGGGASLLGDFFILVNASSYAVFLVMVKPLMSKYSALTVMSWCFLVGSILVVPF
ncbi:MAG TPA: EamA/RhaT family transporter, partial [Flavobacteriales bacterium]|nr:EamA/RhaT family transporter [Flavobacteriales bacterium]